ncbi:MAG: T9SS type A sorting domain-containing protein [Ignavibacteriaceae bacterium]
MKFRLLLTVILGILFLFIGETKAQWVQTNGPSGTTVTSFAVNNNNLFAGTYDGGVFLSTDNGTSWSAVNSGLTNTYVETLAISGNKLFAGTHDGVYLSTNNGTNWTVVNNGLPSYTSVYAFAVTNTGTGGTDLFAGTYVAGEFLSTNNGTSWNAVNSGLTNDYVQTLAVSPTGTSGYNLFAGTKGGIFLSTNNGTSWNAVNSGLTNKDVFALAVSGSNLFAGTYNGGVFLSTDNGTSWNAVNSGLTNTYINGFAISGNNLFTGTSGGVFLSTNNGTSWTEVNSGLANNYVNAFVISGTTLFAGTNGNGVWRRTLSEMVTLIKDKRNDLPADFSLAQNYPNPFNPTTTINYLVPKTSLVTIMVYDILGNEVANLVNEEKPVGNYKVEFKASKLSSGIYFYRMQAGSFVETKKLILMK